MSWIEKLFGGGQAPSGQAGQAAPVSTAQDDALAARALELLRDGEGEITTHALACRLVEGCKEFAKAPMRGLEVRLIRAFQTPRRRGSAVWAYHHEPPQARIVGASWSHWIIREM